MKNLAKKLRRQIQKFIIAVKFGVAVSFSVITFDRVCCICVNTNRQSNYGFCIFD